MRKKRWYLAQIVHVLCIALIYYYYLFSPKTLRGPEGGPERAPEGGPEGGSRFCLHPHESVQY